jgi:hypothetical protein
VDSEGRQHVALSRSAVGAATPLLVPHHSRHWAVALREAAVVLALLVGYTRIRLLADDDPGNAVDHGLDVLALERHLHLDIEAALNRALGHLPPLEVFASFWYAALHYTVTPVALVLLYRAHPDRYRRIRSVLVAATAVALIGYLAFPTAPPRLLAGYTDTLATTSSVGWWGAEGSAVRGAGGAVNQFAAMPSMHVGWALWCSLVFWLLARRHWQRVLAAAYAPTTAVVVVATANHWVLDVVIGALLVAAFWLLLRPRPAPEPTAQATAPAPVPVPVPVDGAVDVPAPRRAPAPPGRARVSCGGTPAGRR